MPKVEAKRAGVLGEYGGLGLPVRSHTWQDEKNWGYRSYTNAQDLTRAYVSHTTSRRFGSPALQANAYHFAGEFGGTLAVLLGLALAAYGYPNADSIAALFVAMLVLVAAGRLIRRNVDVLMDRSPTAAEAAARAAVASLDPPVELRRLRVREAAGRHFADVVIAVAPGAAVGQGHAAANAVEDVIGRALAGSDVVVHVEPGEAGAALRERAHAAALAVPRVREVHNVAVVSVGGRNHVSLHLKLPGELALDEAHAVASEVEVAIGNELPDVESVQTHLEPLAEQAQGAPPDATTVAAETDAVRRIVEETTGRPPRELRFLETAGGRIAFVTLALPARTTLADAHAHANEVERRIRRGRPDVVDVVVHTEP